MNDRVVNETLVRIAEDFPGWEEWKRQLRAGMDCRSENLRDPNVIMIRTENLGISISSEISIHDFNGEIYAALTGDQCTITDIRIVHTPRED